MRNSEEFAKLTEEILAHPMVKNMSYMEQHAGGASLLDHLLYTAYVAFTLSETFPFLKLNTKELVRAALLHDFRVNDSSENRQCFSHSAIALEEAKKHFNLTELEENAILAHMWPITPHLLPKSMEAFVLNISDTYCATMEVLHLFNRTRVTKLVAQRVLGMRDSALNINNYF